MIKLWHKLTEAFYDGWQEARTRWGDKQYVSLACNTKRHPDCSYCECSCHKTKRMRGYDD